MPVSSGRQSGNPWPAQQHLCHRLHHLQALLCYCRHSRHNKSQTHLQAQSGLTRLTITWFTFWPSATNLNVSVHRPVRTRGSLASRCRSETITYT